MIEIGDINSGCEEAQINDTHAPHPDLTRSALKIVGVGLAGTGSGDLVPFKGEGGYPCEWRYVRLRHPH
jgi:hypothetical protein